MIEISIYVAFEIDSRIYDLKFFHVDKFSLEKRSILSKIMIQYN